MPSVVLDNQDWSDNFVPLYYTKTSIEDAASLITTLYNDFNAKEFYDSGAFDYVKGMDHDTDQCWVDFVAGYKGRQATSNQAKINTFEHVKYKDYIKGLERKHLAREDFESVLTNRHKFKIIYTDNNTYLTKDASFIPTEDSDSEIGRAHV